MPDITVLCVDPGESGGSTPVDDLAAERDVEVLERKTVAGAKDALAARPVDCLVTEYDLPDGTGMELISHVRAVGPDTGCILCTDADRDLVAAEMDSGHVAEFVSKDSDEAGTRVAQFVRTTAEHRSQTAYPLPHDETERLAALAEYDLDSELFLSAVQRITDLAAAHFDVSQSSVNVITERTQEFLACHGEEWDSTSREQSICAYAILNDGVTVVEDTRADPRFESNEVLEELGIRFYAGATLTVGEGLPIGTVCLYDETAREFTDEDERYLEMLAAETRDWIEVLRQLRDVEDTRGREMATSTTREGGDR
jgi:GAF domain-containing protein